MGTLDRIERVVYNLVNNNPRVKRKIRDIYQSVLDIFPVPDVECDLPVTVRKGYYFGFHDKSPFSHGDGFLACQKGLIPLRMPRAVDELDIGVFEGEGWVSYRPLTRTYAWNWHQGSMLQWVGDTSNVIFNDFDGKSHVARLVDVRTGSEIHRVLFPISAVSYDGSLAISYDFVRSNCGMSGYGYAQGSDPEEDRLIPQRHGIAIGDLRTSELRTLYTLADLVKIEPDLSMEGSFHWITQCQFSPNGRRLTFFHRWGRPNRQHCTRMFSCNTDGSDLHLFPTVHMVSHVGWRNDEEVMAYARTVEGVGYYLFKDRTRDYTRVGADVLFSDGHPQYTNTGRYFVTDTYPDRFRRQRLYVFDMHDQKIHCVGVFKCPKKFVGKLPIDNFMVDLHPRWNRTCNVICFDSGYTGERSLCTVRIPWLER